MDTHLVLGRLTLSSGQGANLRIVPGKFFGAILREARQRQGISQEDMARDLGMTRGNYGHMESGRRKEPLTPDQARIVSRRLQIDMLRLVTAMGYPIRAPGFENEHEMRLLEAYRRASPELRRFLDQGLGLESNTHPPATSQSKHLRVADGPEGQYEASP